MTIAEIASSALGKGLISALIAYSAHYGAAKAYSFLCVPSGLLGFFQGMVTSGSPVCQTGLQVMTATQVSYSTTIMMGISRLFIDWVAPSASSASASASTPVSKGFE